MAARLKGGEGLCVPSSRKRGQYGEGSYKEARGICMRSTRRPKGVMPGSSTRQEAYWICFGECNIDAGPKQMRWDSSHSWQLKGLGRQSKSQGSPFLSMQLLEDRGCCSASSRSQIVITRDSLWPPASLPRPSLPSPMGARITAPSPEALAQS